MDKVSIIVPVYNGETTLKVCLDSIQKQTYENIEVIVVDDGSLDNSGKICDEYAEKDARFKIIHKKNEGVSMARNDALDHSTGEYICFVDGDDYIEADMIEGLYSAVKSNDCGMSVCGAYFDSDEKTVPFPTKPINKIISSEETFDALLRGGNDIKGWLWNKMIHRSIVGDHRLDKNIMFLEDLEFLLRILKNADCKVKFIDKYYYHYIQNSTSCCHQYNMKQVHSIEKFNEKIMLGTPSSDYRIIKNYLKEFYILASISEIDKKTQKEYYLRNAKFIRKKLASCKQLMTKKEYQKCLLISVSPIIFVKIFQYRSSKLRKA